MIKAIICDMDGTLLHSNKQISQENIAAIHKVQSQGILFCIATGRMLRAARMFADALELKTPLIACNGALISDENQQLIYQKPLRWEGFLASVKLLEEAGCYYSFYTIDRYYANQLRYSALYYYQMLQKDPQAPFAVPVTLTEPDIFQELEENQTNIYKILAVEEDPAKRQELRKALGEISEIALSSSFSNNIEIMAQGVSKGQAIRRVASHIGISLDACMCIGDNINDDSMLEICGYPVLMENCDSALQKRPYRRTGSNDCHGVAQVLNLIQEDGSL